MRIRLVIIGLLAASAAVTVTAQIADSHDDSWPPRWEVGPSKYRQVPDAVDGHITVEDGRGPVAGFAFSPIGLEAQIRLTSRWRAYTAGAAGGVWFTREVPTAYSRAFNYTFEVGGGLLWQYRSRESLRVEYKFHHLSNLYSAPNNPGIDGAVFLLGFDRAIGLHH